MNIYMFWKIVYNMYTKDIYILKWEIKHQMQTIIGEGILGLHKWKISHQIWK
jgi:hypothetical protein